MLAHDGLYLGECVSGADEFFVGLADTCHVEYASEDVLVLLLALALLLELQRLLLDPADHALPVRDEPEAVLLEVQRTLDALRELVDCLLERAETHTD